MASTVYNNTSTKCPENYISSVSSQTNVAEDAFSSTTVESIPSEDLNEYCEHIQSVVNLLPAALKIHLFLLNDWITDLIEILSRVKKEGNLVVKSEQHKGQGKVVQTRILSNKNSLKNISNLFQKFMEEMFTTISCSRSEEEKKEESSSVAMTTIRSIQIATKGKQITVKGGAFEGICLPLRKKDTAEPKSFEEIQRYTSETSAKCGEVFTSVARLLTFFQENCALYGDLRQTKMKLMYFSESFPKMEENRHSKIRVVLDNVKQGEKILDEYRHVLQYLCRQALHNLDLSTAKV